MISRRELLVGTAGIASLSALHPLTSLAQESISKHFLYTLEDYIDPAKQPTQMGKLYLNELREPAALVAWATWCAPCVDKIPKYNDLYTRYGDKVHFVSALQEHNIDSVPEPPPLPMGEYMAMCVHNALISKYSWGSVEFNHAMEEIKKGTIESPELRAIVTDCERNTLEAYDPPYSQPARRQELRQTREILQQHQKWPLFPTYLLDHEGTSKYLGGKTAFFVTLFRDGRKIKTLEGKSEKQVEKEFVRLLK